jgi:ankyrin repeat protein
MNYASVADVQSVKNLLRMTDPVVADADGYTPLMWAVGCIRGQQYDTEERQETVRCIAQAVFLKKGRAGLDALDSTKGYAALHWAAAFNMPGVINVLCEVLAPISCTRIRAQH